jgi:hypothetical protein
VKVLWGLLGVMGFIGAFMMAHGGWYWGATFELGFGALCICLACMIHENEKAPTVSDEG